jgi:hypothetical protein
MVMEGPAVNRFREQLSGGTRTSVGEAEKAIEKLVKGSSSLSEIYRLFWMKTLL